VSASAPASGAVVADTSRSTSQPRDCPLEHPSCSEWWCATPRSAFARRSARLRAVAKARHRCEDRSAGAWLARRTVDADVPLLGPLRAPSRERGGRQSPPTNNCTQVAMPHVVLSVDKPNLRAERRRQDTPDPPESCKPDRPGREPRRRQSFRCARCAGTSAVRSEDPWLGGAGRRLRDLAL